MSTAIPSTRNSKKSVTIYDVIPDGDYPARISRFVGLGVQEQPEFKGEKKAPAFKCSLAFELIGVDATGTEYENEKDASEGKNGKAIEARPSCQFQDMYLFPGASRGKVFDLVQVLDPSLKEVPGNLEWFMEQLNEVVNVRVGSYKDKRGNMRNKVVAVGAIPSMFKNQVGAARLETLAFNPYVDSPDMMLAYSNLYKFQRDIIAEAMDKENIPFAGKEPLKQDNGGKPQTTTNNSGTTSSEPPVDFDDDIPF